MLPKIKIRNQGTSLCLFSFLFSSLFFFSFRQFIFDSAYSETGVAFPTSAKSAAQVESVEDMIQ